MKAAMHITPSITSLADLEAELGDDDDEHFESSLKEWCSHLVVVQDGLVYLLHESAREFFICPGAISPKQNSPTMRGSITLQGANAIMAGICMRVLMFHDVVAEYGDSFSSGLLTCSEVSGSGAPAGFPKIDLNHDRFYFIIYAALNWGTHVREAKVVPNDLRDDYDRLCDPSNRASRFWLGLYLYKVFFISLVATCLDDMGVKAILGHLEQIKAEVAANDTLLHSPLQRGGNELLMPTLMAAVVSQQARVVEWLLERGASHNDFWGPYTPLVQLIQSGQEHMLKLVPLFLHKGARTGLVGLEDYPDKSALFLATEMGFADVVDTILTHEESVDAPSTASLAFKEETPLQVAEDAATIAVLVKHGAAAHDLEVQSSA